jgi:hypothetical protein
MRRAKKRGAKLAARDERLAAAAVLTVKDADLMTRRGRKGIAAWLRRQAMFVERHGAEFAGLFRARYLYRGEA